MQVINKSPLSFGERAKLSFADDAGLKRAAESKGYQYAKNNKTGEKYFKKGNQLFKLDEKGFNLGDIADLANETVNLGVAIPTFGVSTLVGGGIPGAVVGGAVSGAAGAGAEKGIGHLLGVRDTSLKDEAKGVATEAAIGGLSAGAFKAASPLVSKGVQAVGNKLTGAKNIVSKLSDKATKAGTNLLKEDAEKAFIQKVNPTVPKWVNPADVQTQKEGVITYLKNKFGTNKSATDMLKKLSSDYKTLNTISNKSVSNAEALNTQQIMNMAQNMKNEAIKSGYDISKGPGKKAFDYVDRRLTQAISEDGSIAIEELKKIYHELGKKGFGGEATKDFLPLFKKLSIIVRDNLPSNIKKILEEQAKINSALPGLIKSATKETKKSSIESILRTLKIPSGILAGKEILDMIRGK